VQGLENTIVRDRHGRCKILADRMKIRTRNWIIKY
jgi:hypothetical protein